MSWMPRPFRSKTRRIPFSQFEFPQPSLEESLEGYARFIFARLAFLKGTPCALLKNHRFIPKGELTLLHVRQHAERESVLGISLAQKSTGLTKSVCIEFPNEYVIEAVGQGCRLVSALVQEGLEGLIELCPDRRIRVWALFPEPQTVSEAVAKVRGLKERAFISAEGTYHPNSDGGDMIELPPYPDPDSGRWSLLLTLEEAERILDRQVYSRAHPEWDDLLGDVRPEKRPGEDAPRPELYLVPDGGLPDSVSAAPEETGETSEATPDADSETEKDPRKVVYLHAEEALPSSPMAGDSEPEPQTEPASEAADSLSESGASDANAEAEAEEEETHLKAYSLSPLSAAVPGLIGQLLSPNRVTVPTPSEPLNELLNGGWTLQRLYVVAGSTGEGKTTFCAWAADRAASHNVPVVFVSFQAPKELLSIYALSRSAKIDSARIERGLCKGSQESGAEDLRKVLMNAGRKYFRTGDYLHVLEADTETAVTDISEAVRATRKHFGLGEGDPVLVVVDSLREIRVDPGKDGRAKTGRPRIAQILLQLRETAKELNAAVIATLDTPSSRMDESLGRSPIDPETFETAVSLSDTCLVLESRSRLTAAAGEDSTLRKRNASRLQDPLDRLVEDFGQHPVLAKRVQTLRKDFPLEESTASTYARVVAVKNRGGRTNLQPLFRYHRAFHDFEPITLDVTGVVG
ncbi:MAG: hypothetical protein HUU16_04245 [Candidatus Omnitrophica bacterium]|nr:hypothetical protein [bacterium]NUN95362.1 hypothetical protein [Candidatus Omnitrophota bacterium]